MNTFGELYDKAKEDIHGNWKRRSSEPIKRKKSSSAIGQAFEESKRGEKVLTAEDLPAKTLKDNLREKILSTTSNNNFEEGPAAKKKVIYRAHRHGQINHRTDMYDWCDLYELETTHPYTNGNYRLLPAQHRRNSTCNNRRG